MGRILGVDLRIDGSWFVVALLVVYSFFLQFTLVFPRLAAAAAIGMAVTAALMFFGSVLVHELAHALVARRRGIEVRGITLFLFGGATHARVESKGPRDEFVVSAVGPVTSLGLAGVLAGLGLLLRTIAPRPVVGTLFLLAWLNLVLAIFNLIPGFPLDGGRLLRSALWARWGSILRATRVAALAGQTVGYLLVATGIVMMVARRVGAGVWLAAIGWFLAQAARTSFQELRTQRLLDGVAAGDLAGAGEPPPGSPRVSPESPAIAVAEALRDARVDAVSVGSDGESRGIVTRASLRAWIDARAEAR